MEKSTELDDISSEGSENVVPLEQRLGLADLRSKRSAPRAAAPASLYRPIKDRAKGPRDL